MDFSVVSNALGLVAQLSVPIVAVGALAALLLGVFQSATQISDDSLSFAGKLLAVMLLLYVAGGYFSQSVESFTRSVWGEQAHYF